MTMHQMKLAAVPFGKMASGRKTIESRLNDEKRKAIQVGDRIEFSCQDEPAKRVSVKVLALHRYKYFQELCSAFPAESFGWSSTGEATEEIRRFYSKEDEEKYGVVGIQIQLEQNHTFCL